MNYRGNGVEETGFMCFFFSPHFFLKNPCEVLGNKMVHFASNSLESDIPGEFYL